MTNRNCFLACFLRSVLLTRVVPKGILLTMQNPCEAGINAECYSASIYSAKPILMTGIKPTVDLHIGNYFGAIQQLVDLTKDDAYQAFIMIADYHALNFVQDAAKMQELTRELAL